MKRSSDRAQLDYTQIFFSLPVSGYVLLWDHSFYVMIFYRIMLFCFFAHTLSGVCISDNVQKNVQCDIEYILSRKIAIKLRATTSILSKDFILGKNDIFISLNTSVFQRYFKLRNLNYNQTFSRIDYIQICKQIFTYCNTCGNKL